MKKVFTTGQVAKICKVAPRTVSKWFDSGRLPGAYRIPGSQDRRIPREAPHPFPQGARHAPGRARGGGMAQNPHHRRRATVHRPGQGVAARRRRLPSTRSPTAASRPASRPRASTPTPSSSTWPWAAARRCRSPRTCAATRSTRPPLIVGLASEDEASPEALAQYGFSESSRSRSTSPCSAETHPHARRGEA